MFLNIFPLVYLTIFAAVYMSSAKQAFPCWFPSNFPYFAHSQILNLQVNQWGNCKLDPALIPHMGGMHVTTR